MDPQNKTPATVYGQPGCFQCKTAVKHLTNKGVMVQYFDVQEDENAMATIVDLGYKSVPVIVMGFEHTSGFDPDWMNERLGAVRPL